MTATPTTKPKVSGSLNSKKPSPYEQAYKEVFDSLPEWRKIALTEDQAEGKDTTITTDFSKAVIKLAESKYGA